MNKREVSLERAADFLWRNARLLERTMFAREFLGGPPGAVINALMAVTPTAALAMPSSLTCERRVVCRSIVSRPWA
jgi:hypothetical protein